MINHSLWCLVGLGTASAVFLAGGIYICQLNEEKLPRAEKLCRNRILGMLLGWAALAWCEPQARALTWDWMLPMLWPMVAIFPILGYWFLDFLFSRAAGGLAILAAYYYLQEAFALNLELHIAGAFLAWSLGFVGIAISAKPCYLRDWFRAASRKKYVRWSMAGYLFLLALTSLLSVIFNWEALS